MRPRETRFFHASSCESVKSAHMRARWIQSESANQSYGCGGGAGDPAWFIRCVIGVAIKPGHTRLTRMLRPPTSFERLLVMPGDAIAIIAIVVRRQRISVARAASCRCSSVSYRREPPWQHCRPLDLDYQPIQPRFPHSRSILNRRSHQHQQLSAPR